MSNCFTGHNLEVVASVIVLTKANNLVPFFVFFGELKGDESMEPFLSAATRGLLVRTGRVCVLCVNNEKVPSGFLWW